MKSEKEEKYRYSENSCTGGTEIEDLQKPT